MSRIKKVCSEIWGLSIALLQCYLLLEFYILSRLIIFSQSFFSVLFIYFATTIGGLVIYRNKNGINKTWYLMLSIYAFINHWILVFCYPGEITKTLCDGFNICY